MAVDPQRELRFILFLGKQCAVRKSKDFHLYFDTNSTVQEALARAKQQQRSLAEAVAVQTPSPDSSSNDEEASSDGSSCVDPQQTDLQSVSSASSSSSDDDAGTLGNKLAPVPGVLPAGLHRVLSMSGKGVGPLTLAELIRFAER